jgi:hypothetical protein
MPGQHERPSPFAPRGVSRHECGRSHAPRKHLISEGERSRTATLPSTVPRPVPPRGWGTGERSRDPSRGTVGERGGRVTAPGWADLEKMAKTDMRARERSLYVEVSASGAPMTPEGVAEAEATKWVTAMSGLFSTLGKAWLQSLDDDLAEAEGQASTTV